MRLTAANGIYEEVRKQVKIPCRFDAKAPIGEVTILVATHIPPFEHVIIGINDLLGHDIAIDKPSSVAWRGVSNDTEVRDPPSILQ